MDEWAHWEIFSFEHGGEMRFFFFAVILLTTFVSNPAFALDFSGYSGWTVPNSSFPISENAPYQFFIDDTASPETLTFNLAVPALTLHDEYRARIRRDTGPIPCIAEFSIFFDEFSYYLNPDADLDEYLISLSRLGFSLFWEHPELINTFEYISIWRTSNDKILFYYEIYEYDGSNYTFLTSHSEEWDFTDPSGKLYINKLNDQFSCGFVQYSDNSFATITGGNAATYTSEEFRTLLISQNKISSDFPALFQCQNGVTSNLQGQLARFDYEGSLTGSYGEFEGKLFDYQENYSDCPESVPTLSEWGMIIMSFLLALSGLYIFKRRQEY